MVSGINKYLLWLVLLTQVFSCTSTNEQKQRALNQFLGISVVANNSRVLQQVNDGIIIINLKSDKFSFSIAKTGKRNAIMICAFTDKRQLESLNREGLISGNACFRSGTGIAISRQELTQGFKLRIGDGNSNNYFDYSRTNNSGSSRLIKISHVGRLGDKSEAAFEGQFYAVIFVDLNSNNKIDKGETEKWVFNINP